MTVYDRPLLALIPARANSKGVPGKNVRVVCGKPLIAYTIEAALQAANIDRTFVSSDDPIALDIARSHGVDAIIRPAALADDQATAIDVISHFFDVLPKSVKDQDPFIIYLQPTSPLRNSGHISDAISQMVNAGGDSLVSVAELETSPYKCFRIDQDTRLQSLFDERLSNANRQELPKTYLANGAIYVFRYSKFQKHLKIPSNGSVPFFMDKRDSLDIDSEPDFNTLTSLIGGEPDA